ncbi:MAG: phosphatase [Bacillota bacterium]|jgi:putative hydrolase|nr:phosphatase [Bacillota bacterium]
MMKLVADCHFHTVSSGHAYSTLDEYAREASMKSLELIAMTDHGPAMPGSANIYYFHNLRVIPNYLYDVEILKGMEANIIGTDGSLDISDLDAEMMDVLIASFHMPCLRPGTIQENTRVYLEVMKNKYVNVIGHPDDSRIPVDYEVLTRAAAEYDILLEINNSSLRPISFRANAKENYIRLLEGCAKHNASVIVNTDSHIHTDIGEFNEALTLIREVGFPKDLIANTSVERLKKKLVSRRG